jgi:hypothetical protein
MTTEEKASFDARVAERLLGILQRSEAAFRDLDEEFDDAERRKQALKARIRQMDRERRARYTVSW